MRRNSLIVVALALVVAGAAGWWMTGVRRLSTVPPVQPPHPAGKSSAQSLPSVASPVGDTSASLAPDTKDDLLPTSLQRFTAAISQAVKDKAPAEELARLINGSRAKLKPGEHANLLSQAIQQLAKSDPAKAAQVLRQLKDLHDQQIMASGVPAALVASNPRAAASFASSLAGHDMARTAHQVVGREWAKTDRVAAVAWLNQTSNPVLQAAIAEGVAQTWASSDMDGLTSWAGTIPDAYVQTSVLVKAAKVMSATDPARASEWAMKFPSGFARKQALTFTSGEWGFRDPQAASQWAQQITAPDARLSALTGVMRGWLRKDQRSANAWMQAMPESDRTQVMTFLRASEAK